MNIEQTFRYKDGFKTWWFWIVVICLSILNLINDYHFYGNIFLAEILGIVLGNILLTTVIYSGGFLALKLTRKIFKKKQEN